MKDPSDLTGLVVVVKTHRTESFSQRVERFLTDWTRAALEVPEVIVLDLTDTVRP